MGLTSSAGALPADRTWTRPSAWWSRSVAAIWLRPALCTHTNRTSGTGLPIVPFAWPRAWSRSRANRWTRMGTNRVTVAPDRNLSADSSRYRVMVSCDRIPANSLDSSSEILAKAA